MSEALPVGTLLFDPGDGRVHSARATIWTVTSARTIVASVDGLSMKATLTEGGLPKGWRIIANRELATQMALADPRALKGIFDE